VNVGAAVTGSGPINTSGPEARQIDCAIQMSPTSPVSLTGSKWTWTALTTICATAPGVVVTSCSFRVTVTPGTTVSCVLSAGLSETATEQVSSPASNDPRISARA